MRSNIFYIVICIMIIYSQPLNALMWYINDTSTLNGDIYTTEIGNDSNSGLTPSSPKRSLAIISGLIKAGDTIFIDAGIFYETLNIETDYLNIIGVDPQKTIINASDSKIESISGIKAYSTNNIMIKNIKVINSYYGIDIRNLSTPYEGSLIENCITNNNTFGIFISNSGGISQNIRIVNNRCYNNAYYGFYCEGINHRIINNEFYNNKRAGLRLTNSNICIVEKNISYDNAGNGLEIMNTYGGSHIVRDNICYNNSGDGILYEGVTNGVLENNEVYNNSNNGIFIYTRYYGNVIGNHIKNNKVINNFNGIRIEGTAGRKAFNNMIYNNTLILNSNYAVIIEGTSYDNIFTKNNIIIGESGTGIYNNSPNSFNFTRNYWGTTNEDTIYNMIQGPGRDLIVWNPYRFNFIDTTIGADTVAPASPDIITVENITEGILISWNEVTKNEEQGGYPFQLNGYRIYRSTDPNIPDWQPPLGEVSSSETQYIDNDIMQGETYYYRVTSFDTYITDGVVYENESWYSDIISVFIQESRDTYVKDEMLVKFDKQYQYIEVIGETEIRISGPSKEDIENFNNLQGCEVKYYDPVLKFYQLKIPANKTVEEMI
ncbi:MAG: right-handed parallel beta-helix repeat-containing protein, partial [Candidatus Hydrogenedentota bacterium]